ncbi:MAG TPA: hypothetical protein VF134_01240 [Candidatus Dormibacteraeota bacterium]
MRRALLVLAAVASAYLVAAWLVQPGFFDGPLNAPSYRWLSPPPGVVSAGAPLGGHGSIPLRGGQSEPASVFTGEAPPQVAVSLLPGSFEAATEVEIRPVAGKPPPAGQVCVTNIYLVTASRPLRKEAVVALEYSSQLPDPSAVYWSPDREAGWSPLANSRANGDWYIWARSTQFGYFVACYPSGAIAGPRLSGQTLPIIVALGIVLVLVAGIPLAVLRRAR